MNKDMFSTSALFGFYVSEQQKLGQRNSLWRESAAQTGGSEYESSELGLKSSLKLWVLLFL